MVRQTYPRPLLGAFLMPPALPVVAHWRRRCRDRLPLGPTLVRYADICLTMNGYRHTDLAERAEAIRRQFG